MYQTKYRYVHKYNVSKNLRSPSPPKIQRSAGWHQTGLTIFMVFITRSRFLAVFLPAFCAALFAFPTRTCAQLPWRSPKGLFQIGGDAWENPIVDGLRVQIKWADIQPDNEAEFDWSSIDQQVANSQAYQKQIGISLVILSAPPNWLTAIPGVSTYLTPPRSGQLKPFVLPWDPIVQSRIINFVTQLCLRYDGLVDYIVMGGLGVDTESYLPDPDEIGLDMSLEEAVVAWTDSSNNIIDAYGTHLHSTPFIIATAIPFSGTDAPTALSEMLIRAATMYGQHFGTMQTRLNAQSTNGDLSNALVADYSPTNPAGFQFLCPVAGDESGQTLGGTLEQTLDAALALGAQWLEIFSDDAQNADYSAAFENARTGMAAPPPATKAPHGLYEIGGDAFTNPGIGGLRAELQWSKSNPSEGVYDWTRIDLLVANAVRNHKQIGLSVRILSSVPTWVTSLPGVKTYISPQGPDPMVLPFDALVQPKIIAYITALCLHFDGKLDYIVMGGLGYKTETYMPLPADIGLNMSIASYTTAWINSSDLLIDKYNQNLRTTPFVLAGGIPFDDPGASAAIATIINHGLLYPPFGIMQWGLNANSNNGFLINKFIQDNDLGRATGFQLTGASDGSVGGDLQGTLEEALTAGAALGADWIEIYAVDAMNPVYAPLLATFNRLLK